MEKSVFRSLVAAAVCAAASSSSATTLDFDSGTAVISGNVLSQYSPDGLEFSITQTRPGSIGANLFKKLYCVNGSGGAAKCGGNDDGDLVPRSQGENSLTSFIGIGDSFDVRYAGFGGVDSSQLVATPLRAGFVLLFAGLGTLAFWRRRRPTWSDRRSVLQTVASIKDVVGRLTWNSFWIKWNGLYVNGHDFYRSTPI